MSAHQSEIRFELPRDELAVLDGFVQATGKSRGEVMRELLKDCLDHKVTTVERSDGTSKMVEQVLVTPKGLTKLATALAMN